MNEIKTKLMITKKLKNIIRFIVESCICLSWVLIHLTTIAKLHELDISTLALRLGSIALFVSTISLPIYFFWRVMKRTKDKRNG